MLRLIANRAKNHYNKALEHAERGRNIEAIAELHNALQLDSNLAEAHLLLGTLYAREERTDDARTEWASVLEKEPAAKRAHHYLNELPQLERTLPLARRLRGLLAGAAIFSLCAAGIATASLWPSRKEQLLDEAWEHFAAKDLHAATQSLHTLARPLSNKEQEQRARLLEEAIDTLVQDRLAIIQDHIAQANYDLAARHIAMVGEWSLPDTYSHALSQQETILRRLAEQELRNVAEREYTPANHKALQQAIAEFEELFPNTALPTQLENEMRARGQIELEELLLQIDRDLAAGAFDQAAPRIEAASVIAAGLDAEELVAKRRAAHANALLGRSLDEIESHADEKSPDEILAMIDALELAEAPPTITARALKLRESIAHRQRTQFIEELEQLLASGDDRAIAAHAAGLGNDQLGQLEPRVQTRIEEARRRVALDSYYWLMARADAFEQRAIGEAEAREALERLRHIGGRLPATVAPVAADDLLFFEAISQEIAGDADAAARVRQRLIEEHPRSPYVLLLGGRAE